MEAIDFLSMVKVVNTVIKRHTFRDKDNTFLSNDLVNLFLAGSTPSPITEGGTFEQRRGYINILCLPEIIRCEVLQIVENEEPVKQVKRSIGIASWSPPPSVEFYLRQDLLAFKKHVNYFKDIFADNNLAVQKAKSVCVFNHLTSKLDEEPYLKAVIVFLKREFPDCELLRDDVVSFRKALRRYKKVGLLNGLIESSL
ncbi:MAG: hypothetical protein OJF59_002844 [Cytophagales bacterium]|jgi:hypothetical protein|nr:hypothetical protein [Bacteroidota bacterium]MBS1981763.1 hypothetical protein [Bacteroidota bacterium]WHZ09089.1 MAG: hypothetical protein OJF59_002844 [Cytophagales bacterium]